MPEHASPGAPSRSSNGTHQALGEVLTALRDEFPDITISKIRFLESQGLIDPERTPSGYRKFYASDVDRLRWILRQQREHFLPLKVIRGRLEELEASGGTLDDERAIALDEPLPEEPVLADAHVETTAPARDAAIDAAPVTPVARRGGPDLPLDDGAAEQLTTSASGASLTRAELSRAAGLDDAQLAELEAYGLLSPSLETGDRVLFDEDGLAIARLASGFFRHGVEARHLRMYRTFADREAVLFEQVLLGYLRQRNPEARARAQEQLEELARLGRGLRTAYLRRAVREALGE